MKTFFDFKTPKTLLFSLISLFMLSVLFTSCTKDDNNAGLSAYVMATNSAEASAPQDFYADNNKLNGSAMAYTQSSSYITIGAGTHQLQFKTATTATVNSSISQSFSSGKYYSVFYTDDKSAVTAEDDRTMPQSGKARVRFINLSSAINSNVDFAVAGGSKLVSALSYKAASAYYDVDAATAFSLSVSGSSSVLLNIPASIQAGHIYTIYISGATTATVTYHVVAQN